ncbi:tRNA uridine-5-carboxymethylaminomethyl(34) synthesis GTPase MnmE [Prosthecomicrobium hirschii]|uniref:tRNA uridine-5-carboxymethylaminomethyl(34) synthesis GTPase MnmE n=1 Tax=Prosthecodimorpha hirschii TaxID=665126 RepID=UPI00112AB9B0|nr:tRNA uridine-5-carboxymethylaminomethyl(34) synthesis GTPase MnmE [Prosthecomicrobium hirschii]TPQ49813.1 tRNA uridine-5-carboxymethylaminomethyl(34) synthesis GTPase MnmE [Prosthecomicrobium hirschii]
MSRRDETIFALSSGALPSGVAVIRLSGPESGAAVTALVGRRPEPRRAALRTLRAGDGSVIDRGLVLWLPGPASFTGEDMAEFQVHGGPAVVAALLACLADLPRLRAAEPGEFTRRAFLAGRIDLAEAEGLADLVAAETEAQRRQAIRQSGGALSRQAEAWRTRIVTMRALIEAELDFPDEDDVPGSVSDAVWSDAAALLAEIETALADAGRGERLRRGYEVVLTGPPNAGKSSLLNALARRDAAIVTEEPGTTRDLIEVRLDLDGLPVILVDSAGLRDAAGRVEQEGIRRARERAAAADLVLWLSPADAPAEPERPASGVPLLVLRTKCDLTAGRPDGRPVGVVPAEDDGSDEVGGEPAGGGERGGDRAGAGMGLPISAATGEGLDRLRSEIASRAGIALGRGEDPLITRTRHREALTAAADGLRRALRFDALPLELRAEELRAAGDAIGRITGRVGVEDLLDVIFGQFCIGK